LNASDRPADGFQDPRPARQGAGLAAVWPCCPQPARAAGAAWDAPSALSPAPTRTLTIRNRPSARSRARTRRYLEPESGCLRCKRRGCFVCFFLRGGRITWTVSPPQASASPLVAAAFRTKWLLRERCVATCQRRRRPGQARRRQGWLQITASICSALGRGPAAATAMHNRAFCQPWGGPAHAGHAQWHH